MRKLYKIVNFFGFDTIKIYNVFVYTIPFFISYFKLKNRNKSRKDFTFGPLNPILGQHKLESGSMTGHYFHQDLLIAARIYQKKPKRHLDIGSRTDGFVAHVASFREIEVLDIRPQSVQIKNILFKRANLMELDHKLKNYCDSISALHSLEHFGLGRYGDPIDYDGYKKGIMNIYQILQSGGKFYFSVPIGKQRIEFNAHRVFSVCFLIDLLKDLFFIDNFSYVNDKGELTENAQLTDDSIYSNFGCHYGCGIFELTKK